MVTGNYKLSLDDGWWTIWWGPLVGQGKVDQEAWEKFYCFRLGECEMGAFEEASRY